MAYVGRGGFSSFGGGSIENGSESNEKNGNINKQNIRRFFGDYTSFYYYVPLDNTYVIFQMIASIIIFSIVGITFLITYKPSVIDPIESTKKITINTYIAIILSLVVLTVLANHLSKDKNALFKRLITILIVSSITILVFLGIKINLNSTYTKDKFEQIYTQENGGQESDAKTRLNFGLTAMEIITEKEFYINECLRAYKVFSIRFYIIIGLNVLLIIWLIYQANKVSKIQQKRDTLSKNDAILFDNEENVKF